MAFTPGLARADGGPASDVLSSQALFVPPDAGLSATQQAQLGALVAAARADGYDLRVAVIARSADLGSVTALWRQPANYARFLGQEIALVAHGPLPPDTPSRSWPSRRRRVETGAGACRERGSYFPRAIARLLWARLQ
jgi:hypothetical protein